MQALVGLAAWIGRSGGDQTPGLLPGAPGDKDLPAPQLSEDSNHQFVRPARDPLQTQPGDTSAHNRCCPPGSAAGVHTEDLGPSGNRSPGLFLVVVLSFFPPLFKRTGLVSGTVQKVTHSELRPRP